MTEEGGRGHRAALELDASAEHGLRNHLSIILGFCDVILRETSLSALARADVEEIHSAATAALGIVTAGRRRDAD